VLKQHLFAICLHAGVLWLAFLCIIRNYTKLVEGEALYIITGINKEAAETTYTPKVES
jgi:hypothetical protein